jgi:hypothetical protein
MKRKKCPAKSKASLSIAAAYPEAIKLRFAPSFPGGSDQKAIYDDAS